MNAAKALFLLGFLVVGTAVIAGNPGEDGSLTVSTTGQVLNAYTTLSATTANNATSISVVSVAALALPFSGTGSTSGTALAADDVLLIYQPQGANIRSGNNSNYGSVSNYRRAGYYEFVTVSSVSGTTINLTFESGCGPGLVNRYSLGAQVIRVPQYQNLTISSSGEVVATDWNGTIGGVVTVHVLDTLALNGEIDVSGQGFRGGRVVNNGGSFGGTSRRSSAASLGGEKGEGIAGSNTGSPADYWTHLDNNENGSHGRGAPANGGGGGNNHNAAGGGGANGGTGTWNGQGNPVSGYNSAWNLDPTLSASTTSPGGGRGGYTYSSSNQDATMVAPGNTAWAGDDRREVGGLGGRPLDRSGGRFFFGGGGGAGDTNNSSGTDGGDGGGLVFLVATNITGTGDIFADGEDGGDSTFEHRDGQGGGGGGGTVVIVSESLSSIDISADGGDGGDQTMQYSGNANESEGPGGGGGGGVIAVSGGTPGSRTATGGAGGTSNTNAVTEFPPNGATAGGAGEPNETAPSPSCVTLPVQLAYVKSVMQANALVVEWVTAMEAANAGFWVEAESPSLGQVSRFVPTTVVDGSQPTSYSAQLPADVEQFRINDVDIRGQIRRHGPFAANRTIGVRPQTSAINWPSIQSEVDQALLAGRGISVEGRLFASAVGVQRVTYGQLQAAGIELAGVASNQIAIVGASGPVSRYVDGPAVFGAGSAIEFVAEPQPTLYSKEQAFELRIAPSLAVEVQTGFLQTPAETAAGAYLKAAAYDQISGYNYSSPAEEPWYAERLLAFPPDGASVDWTIDLDDATGYGLLQLAMQGWGASDFPDHLGNDHHLRWLLDDQLLEELWFDGLQMVSLQADRAMSLLGAAATLSLDVPADTGLTFDLINLERFDANYEAYANAESGRWSGQLAEPGMAGPNADVLHRSGFERSPTLAVAGFAGPVAYSWSQDAMSRYELAGRDDGAEGFTFALPAEGAWHLVEPIAVAAPRIEPGIPVWPGPGAADVLIVYHPALQSALQRLEATQHARGYSTHSVSTDQIYAAFSDHLPSGEAIRTAIALAAGAGTRYVQLIGGDALDYRDDLSTGAISLVPTVYTSLSDIISWAPSDALLADIDGDDVPDLGLARLPARTEDELTVMLDKLDQVASLPAGLVRVSDQRDGTHSYLESHQTATRKISQLLPLDAIDLDSTPVETARLQLLQAFNQPPELISFMGHSSFNLWSTSSIFTGSDAASVMASGLAPIVAQWGCWNSYFVRVDGDNLMHQLMVNPHGGAAMVIGSTALTSNPSHEALATALFNALAAANETPWGDLLLQAQREAGVNQAHRDAVLGVALFGDPTLPYSP